MDIFEENNLDDLIKKILYHLKTQKISKNDCRRVVECIIIQNIN